MSPTAARILQAVADRLADRDLEDTRGGTVSIIVKVDVAGCPRRITVRTEVEHPVERKRPCAMAI